MSGSDQSTPLANGEKAERAFPRPFTITRLALLAYTLAAAWVVADQLSKAWVLTGLHLVERGSVTVVPGLFHLTMVWNQGFSFHLFANHGDLSRWGLSLFSGVVAVGIGWWARRVIRPLPAVALGLVMGGAVGNLIDRVRLGAVVDFLDFSGAHFPWVFNVADSGISVGVALLLADSLLAPKPRAAPTPG